MMSRPEHSAVRYDELTAVLESLPGGSVKAAVYSEPWQQVQVPQIEDEPRSKTPNITIILVVIIAGLIGAVLLFQLWHSSKADSAIVSPPSPAPNTPNTPPIAPAVVVKPTPTPPNQN